MAEQPSESSEASERPIQCAAQDILQRTPFIKRLSDVLIDPTNFKSTGVVVAVTGPWGSGKSSILNLIQEEIESRANDLTVVVRFNPWLVSTRDDLIQQFFAEVLSAVKAKQTVAGRAKSLLNELPNYAHSLLPIAVELASYIPGASWLQRFKGTAEAVGPLIARRSGLSAAKRNLQQALVESGIQIVVLVDEVDRVEDSEIVTVAQLVRSIVDFEGVSYCLAYDAPRVAEALGGQGGVQRGRSYLEKIVQFSFPIPYTFADEIKRVLRSEIARVGDKRATTALLDSTLYQELEEIVLEQAIESLRDVKRLAGTFKVLVAAVGEEVLNVDLLAYSILHTKFPDIVERIRKEPDLFVEDSLSAQSQMFLMSMSSADRDEKIKRIFGEILLPDAAKKILEWLFPVFAEGGISSMRREDPTAIHFRRPLLTTLRLGVVPGYLSRLDVLSAITAGKEQTRTMFEVAISESRLDRLVAQLYELLPNEQNVSLEDFWQAAASVLEPKGALWTRVFSPEQFVVRDFEGLFSRLASKNPQFRSRAPAVLQGMLSVGHYNLAVHILWNLFFVYGLYGKDRRSSKVDFISARDVEGHSEVLAEQFRREHLQGDWFASLGNVIPLLFVRSVGKWDQACKERLQGLLKEDQAVDSLIFMMFRDHFTTDAHVIESLVGLNFLKRTLEGRLIYVDEMTNARMRAAIKKAAVELRIESQDEDEN